MNQEQQKIWQNQKIGKMQKKKLLDEKEEVCLIHQQRPRLKKRRDKNRRQQKLVKAILNQMLNQKARLIEKELRKLLQIWIKLSGSWGELRLKKSEKGWISSSFQHQQEDQNQKVNQMRKNKWNQKANPKKNQELNPKVNLKKNKKLQIQNPKK